jgi:hypothetical protein
VEEEEEEEEDRIVRTLLSKASINCRSYLASEETEG